MVNGSIHTIQIILPYNRRLAPTYCQDTCLFTGEKTAFYMKWLLYNVWLFLICNEITWGGFIMAQKWSTVYMPRFEMLQINVYTCHNTQIMFLSKSNTAICNTDVPKYLYIIFYVIHLPEGATLKLVWLKFPFSSFPC